MNSIAMDTAFGRSSTWPLHEDFLGSLGTVMKCPARDPYEERLEDETNQHRWYQDHWGTPSMSGAEFAREWPRDPVEFDDFEADIDDEWPPQLPADEYYYTIKTQHKKRSSRNQARLLAASERRLRHHQEHGRTGYDQDFAHNVVSLFPKGMQSNVAH